MTGIPRIRRNDFGVLAPPELGAWEPTRTVTVVIPAYNRQETLDLTLAALSAQTYPEHLLDVIVVDDGSSTPLHLPEIVPSRTKLVSSPPGGWGRAWAVQAGLDAATGEVVFVLDADMVPHRHHVEAQLRWHHLAPYVVVLGWIDFTAADSTAADSTAAASTVADSTAPGSTAPDPMGRGAALPTPEQVRRALETGTEAELFPSPRSGTTGPRRSSRTTTACAPPRTPWPPGSTWGPRCRTRPRCCARSAAWTPRWCWRRTRSWGTGSRRRASCTCPTRSPGRGTSACPRPCATSRR
ncbi:glycosyltransferase family 2 protein [Nonomuraea antimicrobica]